MKLAMGKALSGRGPLLATAVAAGALAGVAGTSVATSVAGADDDEGPVTARLSVAHAAETALEAVPGGHIEGLELDYNGRVLMWEVDIVAADGAMRELHVDSDERRVLANRLDPPEAGEDGDCAGDGDLTPGPSDQAAALRSARITAVQAARIASEVLPGTLTSVDFEYRSAGSFWGVDITDNDGRAHTLLVDAATGEIVSRGVEEEDDG
ncbi:hypothetical protein Acsp03_12890 [Actinomadura sp. NBRC 104412]|uniref:PepSY domain-containing protein n=1 Tax=Actinomadura sp. NBRC 104412 TaxID=3032203 RepID=UPI0024A0D35E|nr:PepSY domain-containing protein [Actinomadura sp. NBRC 104412]GLZ03823.1 hypothetical protein Acsp03_12890 [Actinomadura sp. NBRC 104412]